MSRRRRRVLTRDLERFRLERRRQLHQRALDSGDRQPFDPSHHECGSVTVMYHDMLGLAADVAREYDLGDVGSHAFEAVELGGRATGRGRSIDQPTASAARSFCSLEGETAVIR